GGRKPVRSARLVDFSTRALSDRATARQTLRGSARAAVYHPGATLLQVTAVVRPLRPFTLSAFFTGVLAVSIGAQGPPPQRPPTIRTRVDAVSVDVVATDAKGQPVADLTAADFEVREDGTPQTIDSFKRI